MDKRALSKPSPGSGGSSKPPTMPSSHIIDFIIHHQFIDSVIVGHSYDYSDEEKCNVDDLHKIVEEILFGVISFVDHHSFPKMDLTDPLPQNPIPNDILYLIEWVHCQMTCQATLVENVGQRLRQIFQKLRSYRWTTQVLLVLAAFALQYGDVWYAAEAPPEGRHALSCYIIYARSLLKKKVISDKKKKEAIKPLNKVVSELCELTTSLFELTKLVNQYRGKHVPELAKAIRTIPGWSCGTIIAILATGNILSQIIGIHRLAESEMETLASIVSELKNAVLKAIQTCKIQIGLMEDYQKYVKRVEAPVDIMDFLRSLLAKDFSPDPIVTGPNDTPVNFGSFRKKNVLLIISNQKISDYDIATLEKIHADPRRYGSAKEEDQKEDTIQIQTEKETLYELVWIPMVDPGYDKLEALPSYQSVRRWAFIIDPFKMHKFASRYIKEEWHFKRETMVVVLDSLGWVENPDAMPMLRTWEREAFPYTGNESTHPWKDTYWSWVQLVLREPVVRHVTLEAIKTEYILFYGGTAATKLEADVAGEIPNVSVVPIEDTKRFFILLRSCLISRLQALQILPTETEPLRDRIVYEMCEAYRAYQEGGVAIITRVPDLQVQHIGLLSDLKLVRDQVVRHGWTALADKYRNTQGQSICLHICIPHYADLGNLYCPGCSQFMRYDLCLTCCHSDSD